ncbi:MAG: hypothetical protein ABI724_00985 [Betaproteobacteria bacterium]
MIAERTPTFRVVSLAGATLADFMFDASTRFACPVVAGEGGVFTVD